MSQIDAVDRPAKVAALEEATHQAAPEAVESRPPIWKRKPLAMRALLALAVGGAVIYTIKAVSFDGLLAQLGMSKPLADTSKAAASEKIANKFFQPTEAQWLTLGVEKVVEAPFRTTIATDGKVAIDEDNTTPVFTPYAGRVMKLFAKPGQQVEKGKPLFTVEASDMVQGQNDFLTAAANLNKAKRALDIAAIQLKRARELVISNAIAKRDLEQAEIAHVAAVNDLKSGEVALEAARNRLRILGKVDSEIQAFEKGGARISAETTVLAPISGTVVQRKVGPGQFVAGASNDPVFVIGDLSNVWLIANVRETDATKIGVDQPIEFTILAQPGKIYRTKISYVSASVNPDTHRLQVRAEIGNPEGQLRPEMFANVSIATGAEQRSAAVPRNAVIYEGDSARVWIDRGDRTIELRLITLGISSGALVQVVKGLQVGDKIIARGSLFIDRLAAPNVTAEND